jgi:hypothetical protein
MAAATSPVAVAPLGTALSIALLGKAPPVPLRPVRLEVGAPFPYSHVG